MTIIPKNGGFLAFKNDLILVIKINQKKKRASLAKVDIAVDPTQFKISGVLPCRSE